MIRLEKYTYLFPCETCYNRSPEKETEDEAIEAAKKAGAFYDGKWTCQDCATGKTHEIPAVCPDCHKRSDTMNGWRCTCGHTFVDADFLTPKELDIDNWRMKLTRWCDSVRPK